MIYIGIDDTDTPDSRGTNCLARELADLIAADYECLRITRHQLLDDPRVPCTSKNGSASIVVQQRGDSDVDSLHETLASAMRCAYISGSDPGLCVTAHVPREICVFGRRCQRELVDQHAARRLAREHSIRLVGLGGDEGGVIGALAAVGLAAGDDDGRIVRLGRWTDELSGPQPIEALATRGVEVRAVDTGAVILHGAADVGKKLRPNWRDGRCVLFVQRSTGNNDACWTGIKMP